MYHYHYNFSWLTDLIDVLNLPDKKTGFLVRSFEPLKGTKILPCGCGLIYNSPLF